MVLELGPGTCTCPGKVFVVHMTSVATKDAAADLHHVVEALFETGPSESEKPRLLWSLTWNATEDMCVESTLENVKICSGPTTELDFNSSIEEVLDEVARVQPSLPLLSRETVCLLRELKTYPSIIIIIQRVNTFSTIK